MDQEVISEKKTHGKGKLVSFFLIIILGFVGYGYYWFTDIVERENQVEILLQENESMKLDIERYNQLKEAITIEYNRCQEFISQREGDFGSFEYCKKFIDWANILENRG